jgi:hypothetical protein
MSLLLSLGLSAVSAGQPDPRFDGIWVGVETYVIPAHANGGYYFQQGEGPVKKSAVIGISDSGKTFVVGQGVGQGRYDISPSWGENTLGFKVTGGYLQIKKGGHSRPPVGRSPPSASFRRTYGKLVLSVDGNSLTETGLAGFGPASAGGMPLGTCNIHGTFHRQGRK